MGFLSGYAVKEKSGLYGHSPFLIVLIMIVCNFFARELKKYGLGGIFDQDVCLGSKAWCCFCLFLFNKGVAAICVGGGIYLCCAIKDYSRSIVVRLGTIGITGTTSCVNVQGERKTYPPGLRLGCQPLKGTM